MEKAAVVTRSVSIVAYIMLITVREQGRGVLFPGILSEVVRVAGHFHGKNIDHFHSNRVLRLFPAPFSRLRHTSSVVDIAEQWRAFKRFEHLFFDKWTDSLPFFFG